ncbi:glycosyltransferase family 9 protein [Polynucleobacter paneuropaeus]|uniref:Glycosyltransferase family 9 protein n=1 Tax=Polynucleobacter paneuropaeus TaxID=2527775 RepID=A0A2Z4JTX9_9BURK|nr:glycosyltransferase family 9 protein [Polynucleobacter paneuropaeus]AWW50133.1 glycosyltransferase family 9 protein [Polynucleobacter paneuropaeus]MBT8565325.1 glycosyltransferase family 9 protein [Polynucleobacter paneuropaeus]QWD13117.1 glycosyltransferase family 9 protein [Polynucleobacter paneuropaeus]
MSKLYSYKPKKVLFIATRQIGDVLVTTPLISRARELWPDAEFHFLGYRGKLDMLKGNPDIAEIIETSDRPRLPEYLALFNRLFQRYDLAIVTQPSDRAYLYGLLAAFRRVGVLGGHPQGQTGIDNTDHKAERQNTWKKAICIHTINVDYFKQHVIVEKLRLLEVFYKNAQDLFSKQIVVTPPKEESLTPVIASQLLSPYVVVHPGPLTAYKRWPLSYWQILITWLVSQGWQVVLSASSAKQDLQLNQEILSLLDESTRQKVIDTAGKLSIPQAASLIRGALLYVGVDTSITHLAAACNTKTIALFGPTPPTNFGPWPNGFIGTEPYVLRARTQTNGYVTILQGPGECVPCRKAGCDDHPNSLSECLDLLEPAQVITAIEQALSKA